MMPKEHCIILYLLRLAEKPRIPTIKKLIAFDKTGWRHRTQSRRLGCKGRYFTDVLRLLVLPLLGRIKYRTAYPREPEPKVKGERWKGKVRCRLLSFVFLCFIYIDFSIYTKK